MARIPYLARRLRVARMERSEMRGYSPDCAALHPGYGVDPSHPFLVEGRLHAAAVELERALRADRVGALEDPVLPSGEPAEDLRLHGFWPGEAQVGFHAGQRVGREARALLQHDSELVVPVVGLDRAGDEAERVGFVRLERRADLGMEALDARRIAEKARLKPCEAVAHGIEAEVRFAQRDGGGRFVVAIAGADQHERTVGGEYMLRQRAGEA